MDTQCRLMTAAELEDIVDRIVDEDGVAYYVTAAEPRYETCEICWHTPWYCLCLGPDMPRALIELRHEEQVKTDLLIAAKRQLAEKMGAWLVERECSWLTRLYEQMIDDKLVDDGALVRAQQIIIRETPACCLYEAVE